MKNNASSGFNLGIDNVVLARVSDNARIRRTAEGQASPPAVTKTAAQRDPGRAQPGERVGLAIETPQVHLFDAQTQRAERLDPRTT